jgi:hypothetical protein
METIHAISLYGMYGSTERWGSSIILLAERSCATVQNNLPDRRESYWAARQILYQQNFEKLVWEEPFMGKVWEHTPDQIVSLLRQIEVATSNGKINPAACREAGITEQSYYRWRKESSPDHLLQ